MSRKNLFFDNSRDTGTLHCPAQPSTLPRLSQGSVINLRAPLTTQEKQLLLEQLVFHLYPSYQYTKSNSYSDNKLLAGGQLTRIEDLKKISGHDSVFKWSKETGVCLEVFLKPNQGPQGVTSLFISTRTGNIFGGGYRNPKTGQLQNISLIDSFDLGDMGRALIEDSELRSLLPSRD